ncbi:MAG: hypothetical protein J3K34DRAFT_399486 [Monoraphidium minutum]|nr:MAG: hypothetical protein J3K34DRAFT_399486 [Monoraphidium minutum]
MREGAPRRAGGCQAEGGAGGAGTRARGEKNTSKRAQTNGAAAHIRAATAASGGGTFLLADCLLGRGRARILALLGPRRMHTRAIKPEGYWGLEKTLDLSKTRLGNTQHDPHFSKAARGARRAGACGAAAARRRGPRAVRCYFSDPRKTHEAPGGRAGAHVIVGAAGGRAGPGPVRAAGAAPAAT